MADTICGPDCNFKITSIPWIRAGT